MSDEIPFHIQAEIIKRLPVISLLQFRSVSKAWKSLIDSPNFITAHSVTQPQQHLIIKYEDPVEDVEKYVSVLDDDTFPDQRFVHSLPQSVKTHINSRIVGTSHGVLCLHGFEGFSLETEKVVLWNPSVRKSITIDLPKNIDPEPEIDIGFAVCPVSGDPKIIVITQFRRTNSFCEANVYDVSSGKWRPLSSNLNNLSNLPSIPFRILWAQVIVDRFIYWSALDRMAFESELPTRNFIMSFDITNESFGVIEYPESLRRHPSSCLSISKLRGSLVMLAHSMEKRVCNVWMMENGVEKSFTKLFTIDAPYDSRTMTVLGFRKNGKAIMEVDNGYDYIFSRSELVVCEPESERLEYPEILGTSELFAVNSYMETLVLVGASGCSGY